MLLQNMLIMHKKNMPTQIDETKMLASWELLFCSDFKNKSYGKSMKEKRKSVRVTPTFFPLVSIDSLSEWFPYLLNILCIMRCFLTVYLARNFYDILCKRTTWPIICYRRIFDFVCANARRTQWQIEIPTSALCLESIICWMSCAHTQNIHSKFSMIN